MNCRVNSNKLSGTGLVSVLKYSLYPERGINELPPITRGLIRATQYPARAAGSFLATITTALTGIKWLNGSNSSNSTFQNPLFLISLALASAGSFLADALVEPGETLPSANSTQKANDITKQIQDQEENIKNDFINRLVTFLADTLVEPGETLPSANSTQKANDITKQIQDQEENIKNDFINRLVTFKEKNISSYDHNPELSFDDCQYHIPERLALGIELAEIGKRTFIQSIPKNGETKAQCARVSIDHLRSALEGKHDHIQLVNIETSNDDYQSIAECMIETRNYPRPKNCPDRFRSLFEYLVDEAKEAANEAAGHLIPPFSDTVVARYFQEVVELDIDTLKFNGDNQTIKLLV